MKHTLLILLLSLLGTSMLNAQTNTDADTLRVPLFVHVGKCFYHGDSIPEIILPTLSKYPPINFRNDAEKQRYNRLVANVKKTLPIAKLVKHSLIETYEFLETLPTKRAKDEHIKRVEKGIKKQYTPVIKKLTYSQGRLLVKLIDRECDQSSFDIVQAFIGPFKANFYNVFAGLFGNSLKKKYDPEGEDRFTERVVRMVESGQL